MASPAVHSRGPAFDGGARMAARRMKGLRPLRSAQAVAVHQDGIGGRGHPIQRFRFLPGPSQNLALCVAGTDCRLGGRVHVALMQGVGLSEN